MEVKTKIHFFLLTFQIKSHLNVELYFILKTWYSEVKMLQSDRIVTSEVNGISIVIISNRLLSLNTRERRMQCISHKSFQPLCVFIGSVKYVPMNLFIFSTVLCILLLSKYLVFLRSIFYTYNFDTVIPSYYYLQFINFVIFFGFMG